MHPHIFCATALPSPPTPTSKYRKQGRLRLGINGAVHIDMERKTEKGAHRILVHVGDRWKQVPLQLANDGVEKLEWQKVPPPAVQGQYPIIHIVF